MKTSAFLLFFLMLGCLACAPSPEKRVETLQQEVLALHDSAMARMGTLYTHRKELTYLRDSVVVQDPLAQKTLSKGISALVLADEQMMQWMRAYRNPEGKSPEEALTYLQQEKEKIEVVRQVIAQSLRSADSLNTLYRNTSK